MQEAYRDDPGIMDAAVADALAVKERDPACEQYSQCILYFKGYQALQAYRLAHWLWQNGRHVSPESLAEGWEEDAEVAGRSSARAKDVVHALEGQYELPESVHIQCMRVGGGGRGGGQWSATKPLMSRKLSMHMGQCRLPGTVRIHAHLQWGAVL